jgi:hypothetical protein
VAGNLTATTDDESYHGSTSELPPATSHGYMEWDFSSVLDPMMFQRFLDAAAYWFGYSDNSSAESYDPARECFVVLANDQANVANAAEAGDGEVPPTQELDRTRVRGRARLFPHRRGVPTSTCSRPKRVSEAKLAEEYRAVRLLRASITGEASARGERARELGKQARERINADFDVDNPSTPPRASQKLIAAATLLQAMPAPLNTRGAEPAPRGAGAHRASGRATGRELGVLHSPAGERAGRRGRARP